MSETKPLVLVVGGMGNTGAATLNGLAETEAWVSVLFYFVSVTEVEVNLE